MRSKTGLKPQRLIELTTREGPMIPTLTHRFEQAYGGTRYTRHVDIPLEGIFRIMGPIMRATGMAKKRQVRFAENLKNLLEPGLCVVSARPWRSGEIRIEKTV